MPIYLKKEEKEKLIRTWQIISKRYEKFGYKPTEATNQQLDYIQALSKKLDQREASTLITLLQILNKKDDSVTRKPREKNHACESCGRAINHRGNCIRCNREHKERRSSNG